jgi:GNAT superfamily N-acetyltransferase
MPPYPASSLLSPRTWTRRPQKKKKKENKKPPATPTTADGNQSHDHNQQQDQDQDKNHFFFISTDPRYLSVKAVNAAFARDFVYWARPLPEPVMKQLLDASLCFGVYRYTYTCKKSTSRNGNLHHEEEEEDTKRNQKEEEDDEQEIDISTLNPDEEEGNNIDQIGLARLITDTVTFAYLTDVYILPEYQNLGLGAWMMDCIVQTMSDDMPYLRRLMLVTTNRAVDGGLREDYYAAKFGMQVVGTENREDLGGTRLSIMSAAPHKGGGDKVAS